MVVGAGIALLAGVAGVARNRSETGTSHLPSFEMTYSVTENAAASTTTYSLVYNSEWSWTQTVVRSDDPALVGSTQSFDGEDASGGPGFLPGVPFLGEDEVPIAPNRWIMPFGPDGRFRDVSDEASRPGERRYRFERRPCDEPDDGLVLAGDERCANAAVYIDEVTVDAKSGVPVHYVEIDAGVLSVEMKALEWKLLD